MRNNTRCYKEHLIPISKTTTIFQNDEINGDKLNLDLEDAFLYQSFDGLQATFNDTKQFLSSLDSICKYLSDKNITTNYPLFNQIQWNDFFSFFLEKPISEQIDIEILDTIFHFYFTLTSNSYYCKIINIETFINFINIEVTFSSFSWYFPLLSNYLFIHDQFQYFNVDFFAIFFEKVQTNTENPRLLIHPIKFIENYSRIYFKLADRDPQSRDYLFTICRIILNIICYTIGTIPKRNQPHPIIQSISVILEKMTRRDLLDYQLFSQYHLEQFIRQQMLIKGNFKFIKMIALYSNSLIKHKDDPNFSNFSIFDDVFLLGVAQTIEDEEYDPNQYKYSLRAIYNIILLDESYLFQNDSDGFLVDHCICFNICRHLDNMEFSIRKQALMLLSLIYRVMPLSHFVDDELLLQVLSFFVNSADGCDEVALVDCLRLAAQNIYQYLASNPNKNMNLFNLFLQLRDCLIESSNEIECYENVPILEQLTFVD